VFRASTRDISAFPSTNGKLFDMKIPLIIEPERLESMAVADLRPHDRNPRTHSKKQVAQIADRIRRFGFVNPADWV
jgi:hypothetical protein